MGSNSRLTARSAILIFLLTWHVHAQQGSQEEGAFIAVKAATNPAARLAAAEDFVAHFPQSSRRPEVARLVAEHLPIIRNAEIAVSMVARAQAIFSSPSEREFITPVALEIYANGNRATEAFALAPEILKSQPDEIWILIKLTYLGSREVRKSNLRYSEQSLQYGLKAIELIENEQKPTRLSDSAWVEAKAELAGLYQQVGIIRLAKKEFNDAKKYIGRSIELGPREPTSYALLARVLTGEYETLKGTYEQIPDGEAKLGEKKRLDLALDEIIDIYAHAVALATGKQEHQTLIQQLVPDLTRYYKYRHNGSVGGLQTLINKYR